LAGAARVSVVTGTSVSVDAGQPARPSRSGTVTKAAVIRRFIGSLEGV
jgi:hypothetical protein